MGAVDFYAVATGDDLQDAFERAREEAAREHGRVGYSGTIDEKDAVTPIEEPRRLTAEAMERASMLLSDGDRHVDNKWGPAGALPVTTDGGRDGWLIFGVASY
ncbi:hypothetical protein [Streptomyces violascens]|uniref:Uncharacterized protein n=1 Tax=Streptomyces violascens TaxID=67381 RepID=A0ABQ3QVB3_9ACTN|nr:hypothetical protein [Streptomyces violascens]GGU26457.1 hypothetical protein GCM10010289_54710 [Streptomyces violascens]GHI41208.1 hypothetical protein Sviol_56160 [Streptomyces violascens]